MKITLPGKPLSTQHIYGQRGKIRYMKAKAKKLKKQYTIFAKNQYKGPILECELHVVVKLYFPDERRRDRDNRHKITMDSLEGVIYKDDSQIQTALVEKHLDRDNPRTEIYVFTGKDQLCKNISETS